MTVVSVGNPHAVVRQNPIREELLRLGPAIEHHPRFPERTNVQLIRVDGRHDVTAVVWERGAGETRASGTSACAVAAAAIANGWCQSPVSVHMPGGTLDVAIGEGKARLTGPAQEICRGEVSEEVLAEIGASACARARAGRRTVDQPAGRAATSSDVTRPRRSS